MVDKNAKFPAAIILLCLFRRLSLLLGDKMLKYYDVCD